MKQFIASMVLGAMLSTLSSNTETHKRRGQSAAEFTDAGTVQTTDATPTFMVAYTMPADTVLSGLIRLNARRQSNGDYRVWWTEARVERTGTADPTMMVDMRHPFISDHSHGAAAWSFSVTNSGNVISITVTGQTGATIEWSGRFELSGITTN